MDGMSAASCEHFPWMSVSAGVRRIQPPLWKYISIGKRATVLSFDGSFVGLKIRTHKFFSWSMVMSLETVGFPGEGSGFASVVGDL